jgi:hypothetical protein
VDTWTRRLRISWRPTLGFFERRYEVLRRLEGRELLHSFHVEENLVSVRLGDRAHAVAFGPGRIELSTYRPEADVERMRDALELLVDALEPGPARMALGMQALEPLELDYGEARNQAIRRAFPGLPPADESDFAFLLESRQGPEVRWGLEVGVVEGEELPPRFARVRSRVGEPDVQSRPGLWPVDSLPEVSLFSDGQFDRLARISAPSLDELVRAWDDLVEHAEDVISVVFNRLNPMEEP